MGECFKCASRTCKCDGVEVMHGDEGIENGFIAEGPDASGELELRLFVDGLEGSTFLSREVWESLGVMAGWTKNVEQCCERDHDGDGNCDKHPGPAGAFITREELDDAISAERDRIIAACENAERVYNRPASNRIGDKTPPYRVVERPYVLLASALRKIKGDGR